MKCALNQTRRGQQEKYYMQVHTLTDTDTDAYADQPIISPEPRTTQTKQTHAVEADDTSNNVM